MNLYEILGVPRDAPVTKIRAAYRELAKEHHPDKGGDPKKFAQIAQAYAVLSKSAKRKHYDETGQVEEPDKTESTILSLLGDVFNKVINVAIDDMESTDIPKEMLKILKNLEKDLKKLKDEGEKVKASFGDALTRIKKRPDKDVVAEIINARIAETDEKLKQLDEQLKVTDMTIKSLQGYEYHVDTVAKPKVKDPIFSMEELMLEVMFRGAGGKKRGYP